MKNKVFGFLLFVSFVLLPGAKSIAQSFETVVYYPEWRAANWGFTPKDFSLNRYASDVTVLIYSFCEPAPDSSGNVVPSFMNAYRAYCQPYPANESVDGVADDSTQPLRGQFNQLKELKLKFPHLKILISVGGWTGSKYISDAVMTSASRERFADELIDTYIKGNLPVAGTAGGRGAARGVFDGIDVDWEYPIGGGDTGIHNSPDDNDHLSEFFALLRKKLDRVRPGMLLTAAIPGGEKHAQNYNLKRDQKYVDWYNVMTYDYVGSWSPVTGHLAALLNPDTSNSSESFDHSITTLLKKFGVSRTKLVPGVAFYGRGMKEVDTTNGGLYASAHGPAAADTTPGFGYYPFLKSLLSQGFVRHWDSSAMAPWLFNPDQKIFWTYDDPRSISLKYHYVKSYGLRGLMCWEISGDDSIGALLGAMSTGKLPCGIQGVPTSFTDEPNLKLIAPQEGDTLLAGTSAVISVGVRGEAALPSRVEFLVDRKSIGCVAEPPYNWVWFNLLKGRHLVEVIATDNKGSSTRVERKVTVR